MKIITLVDRSICPDLLTPGSVVLDLGADYGAFANAAANRFRCTVYAVEASHTNLCQNACRSIWLRRINCADSERRSGRVGGQKLKLSIHVQTHSCGPVDQITVEFHEWVGGSSKQKSWIFCTGSRLWCFLPLVAHEQISPTFHLFIAGTCPSLIMLQRLWHLGASDISLCAAPARSPKMAGLIFEITAWNFAPLTRYSVAGLMSRFRLVSVILPKSAGALQVPSQMAPFRPLLGHETIVWQWCCTYTSERRGYVPARFPSTCRSLDCYRVAVNRT